MWKTHFTWKREGEEKEKEEQEEEEGGVEERGKHSKGGQAGGRGNKEWKGEMVRVRR